MCKSNAMTIVKIQALMLVTLVFPVAARPGSPDDGFARFEGTVVKLGAEVPVKIAQAENLITVRIDKLISSPAFCRDELTSAVGKTVAIQTREKVELKQGDHAEFSARPWFRVERLSLLQTVAPPTVLRGTKEAVAIKEPMGTSGQASVVKKPSDADLEMELKKADMVIRGEVLQVDSPSGSGKLAIGQYPIREHQASWSVATVKVEQVFKGKAKIGDEIKVAFPASKDIAWVDAPKLFKGDVGIWLLSSDPRVPSGSLALLKKPDSQPMSRAVEIQGILAHIPPEAKDGSAQIRQQ